MRFIALVLSLTLFTSMAWAQRTGGSFGGSAWGSRTSSSSFSRPSTPSFSRPTSYSRPTTSYSRPLFSTPSRTNMPRYGTTSPTHITVVHVDNGFHRSIFDDDSPSEPVRPGEESDFNVLAQLGLSSGGQFVCVGSLSIILIAMILGIKFSRRRW